MGDVRRKKGPASGGTNWSFLQILNWGVIPQLLGCSVYGAKSGGNSTAFSHAVSPSKIDTKTLHGQLSCGCKKTIAQSKFLVQ